jgi:hypothetical protein
MPDLEFLSEYMEGSRTAHLFKLHHAPGYQVIGHDQGLTQEFGPFDTEFQAEDFAEDWVKGFIKDEGKDA